MDDPREPWDGTPPEPPKSMWVRLKELWVKWQEEEERKRNSPRYMRKQERRERRRKKRRVRRSVFDEVTEKNEDGERECIRCGGTDFDKRTTMKDFVRQSWNDPHWAILHPFASTHKVCKKCGAAYPLR